MDQASIRFPLTPEEVNQASIRSREFNEDMTQAFLNLFLMLADALPTMASMMPWNAYG